jgi:SAM-dependent methyltransferase
MALAPAASQAPPEWLDEIVLCPVDRAPLVRDEAALRCDRCARTFGVQDGIVELLAPDRPGDDDAGRWVAEERDWWGRWYEGMPIRPHDPRRGLRGLSRERNLFRHVRERVGERPVVVEMGAGPSLTVGGLWNPDRDGIRYVATDVARAGLVAGARTRGSGSAAVQCDAGTWPFREGSVDVVLLLGVLHHLPDWREALRRACESVRPGGYLLLHEVVWKPRIFARRRSKGVTDHWSSPHEGHVSGSELRAVLDSGGTILRWRGESSPLRFALMHYLRLQHRLENSHGLTAALDVLDQGFGRTAGRIRPSLGFGEVTAVWQRDR